jgi:LmbE family N-acetylglucosaminyl deacetylase
MMSRRHISGALLAGGLALLTLTCHSTTSGVSGPDACGNDALTAYPALLVIAPHPDDETLGFAGLIDAYRRAGKPVSVVVVTDGDAYCEACRFWKNSSGGGSTCTAADLSNFATAEIDSLAEIRRGESTAAASILGLPAPGFLGYPDTGLNAAWRNFSEGETDRRLRRSDFSGCPSCETCSGGYGQGPETTLTADTLMTSLRELIDAAPDGALLATTHWLDGHGDHAGLGNFVRRLNGEQGARHPVAYAVIHAKTPKNASHSDCWYPAPAAPACPCLSEEATALADAGWVSRMASHRFRPTSPAALPDDADYGEETQLCLPRQLYAGDDAVKLRAVRAYGSQLGTLARSGSHPPGLNGMMDCNGYLTSFVRRTEAFVLEEQTR